VFFFSPFFFWGGETPQAFWEKLSPHISLFLDINATVSSISSTSGAKHSLVTAIVGSISGVWMPIQPPEGNLKVLTLKTKLLSPVSVVSPVMHPDKAN
ncbi:hypothetical protein FGIG_08179, partial [Fasciola gigantica]